MTLHVPTARRRGPGLASLAAWAACLTGVVVLAVAFAHVFLRSPQLWFLSPPESVWVRIAGWSGASCCESMADLELAFALMLGLVLASLMAAICLSLKPRWSKPAGDSAHRRRSPCPTPLAGHETSHQNRKEAP